MNKLGAHSYINKDGYIIFPTICHNEDIDSASMKLYYYKDNKFFMCYTNCEGMSIFNLLKNYYETRNIEYNWFQDIVSVVEDCSSFSLKNSINSSYKSIREDYKYQHTEKKLQIYPKGILEVFSKYYPPEWLKDGISKQAMDKYNILYSISQEKIVIPHYDINNNLVGIRGRALNEWEIENVGKYMPIRIENKWYAHQLSLNLYGLNFNKKNIKNTGIAIIVEAEKSVMQAESFPIPNCCVASCGNKFNKYQLNLLLKNCYPKEIVIAYDKEEKEHEEEYFFKLYNICKRYKNYCKMSFIYDRKNLLNLKDSPTDKGFEIFQELFNRRVVV